MIKPSFADFQKRKNWDPKQTSTLPLK
jgi:hypothetical protein